LEKLRNIRRDERPALANVPVLAGLGSIRTAARRGRSFCRPEGAIFQPHCHARPLIGPSELKRDPAWIFG